MLIYDFDKRGKKSIYEYLYECIKKDIHKGKFKGGDKLPSRRQMASDNGIAEITVASAYAQLVTEGYIESREKRGYFVSSDIEEIASVFENEECKKKRPTANRGSECAGSDNDGSVINLSDGNLPASTFPFSTWSKIARKILSEECDEVVKAPESRGLLVLREAIAGYLSRSRGFSPDPEHIIIGPGSEYLSSILLHLIGGSAIVATEDPCYTNLMKLYENSGHKCRHIPVDENGLITDKLTDSNIKLIHVSPSHQFPLGCVMSASRRSALLAWAEKENAWIVEDDYDSEFRFEGRPVPPLSATDPSRVIYMNTFSRTLSPSIRIAYMVLPDELYEIFLKKHSFHSGSVSTLEQLTLASFISEGFYERHLNRVRNYYRKRKNRIFEIAEKGPLSAYFACEGDGSGMTFILRSRSDETEDTFIKKIETGGVLLNSAEEYCYNKTNALKSRYVVNFGMVSEECFEKASRIICSALRN